MANGSWNLREARGEPHRERYTYQGTFNRYVGGRELQVAELASDLTDSSNGDLTIKKLLVCKVAGDSGGLGGEKKTSIMHVRL